jgi:tRNA nucleotidyltransferase/poly(A) polymerase
MESRATNSYPKMLTKSISLTTQEALIFTIFERVSKRFRQAYPDMPDLMGETIPESCKFIWIAGGFARDKILDTESKDIDIIIPHSCSRVILSAIRDECKGFFYEFKVAREPKEIGQGACSNLLLSRFNITINGEIFEIDMRECSQNDIPYLTDPNTRDFTANSGYIDPIEKLAIDPHVGTFESIKSKILKTVTGPESTFGPDPSRMIRAIRFLVTRDFKLDRSIESYIRQKGQEMMV